MSDKKKQGYEDGYSGYVDKDFLDAATTLMKSIKQQTYAMMHVREGQTVLDVGCGPASDTIALSKIVGSTGKVIGIDQDPEMVDAANQRATDESVAHFVEHHHANGLELPFEDNTFDSCRSERVFQHVKEADKFLAEMIRVTKPGGYIVIADADHSTHSTSTNFPNMDLKMREMALEDINNPRIACSLYTLMNLAGLQNVETNPILFAWTDYPLWWRSLGPLFSNALALGIWTEADLEKYKEDHITLHEQNAFYAHVALLLISGRKPE